MMVALSTQPNIWQEDTPSVKRGDVWQLGKHRLMCGDSTCSVDVTRLFEGSQFALCFTSPPYSDQRTYKLEPFNWHSLMCGAFDRIVEHGTPDCHILINLGLKHKNRQVDMYWLEWLLYCATIQWPVFGWYVWDKGSGMPGNWSGRLAPSHEFVFHFNQRGQLINKWVATKENMPASRGFRKADGSIKLPYSPDKAQQPYKVPDSIIRINRACSGEIYRSYHPAVFPVALPEFVYKTWSQPGDIVYEPFCGSGTSIIAGENLNRKVYACEISEEYCELAIKRWQTLTCRKAVQS